MSSWWSWACANPAAAAWVVFGVLSAIVVAYQQVEPKWKALAAKSKTKVDDKLVRAFGVALAWCAALMDFLKLVVPHATVKKTGVLVTQIPSDAPPKGKKRGRKPKAKEKAPTSKAPQETAEG